MIIEYECALLEVETKLRVLDMEFEAKGREKNRNYKIQE